MMNLSSFKKHLVKMHLKLRCLIDLWTQLPPREGRLTVRTTVLAVAGVQLDVAVAGALMFEQARTELAAKWHLIGVRLKIDYIYLRMTFELDMPDGWPASGSASIL